MKSAVFIVFILLSSAVFCQYRAAGEPVKLAGDENNIFINPGWSPDGKSIAFTGANYKGLWILDVSSGVLSEVTDEHAAGFDYEWSSDSKSILTRTAKFSDQKRYNAVKQFDIETKGVTQLSEYSTQMPDLSKYAEKQNSRAAQNTTMKDFRSLLEGKHYMNLRISPDHSKVVYEIYGGNLYIMNTDGSGLSDLGKGYRASWSPDSKSVVYMITEDDGHQYTSSDLYIFTLDSKTKQQLTFTHDKLEMDPDWSPDGTQIVYGEDHEGAVYSITVTNK